MRRRGVGAFGGLAALTSVLAATPAAPAQDTREPLDRWIVDPISLAVRASPDQAVYLRRLIEETLGPQAREATRHGRRVRALRIQGTVDGVTYSELDRWPVAERWAARSREIVRSMDARFRAEAATILTPEQVQDLDRVLRARERRRVGGSGAEVAIRLATVDPFDLLHDVLRDQAPPGPRGAIQPLVPPLDPALSPHRDWLAEQEQRYVAVLAHARRAVRACSLVRRQVTARWDMTLAEAMDGTLPAEDIPRRAEEQRAVYQASISDLAGPLGELADFVERFAEACRQRLPSPFGDELHDRVFTTAYGALHADPTAPFAAVLAMAGDEQLASEPASAVRDQVHAAWERHRALTTHLRAIAARMDRLQQRHGAEPNRPLLQTQVEIGTLLETRRTVADELRDLVTDLVPAEVLARHPLPPPRSQAIGQMITSGRQAAERLAG